MSERSRTGVGDFSAFGALVVPAVVFPKLTLGGLKVTVGEFTLCDTPADAGLARKLVSPL